ncbi:hypothetical protein [Planctomonas deserti]|nr:hypothetical protein [Planctomonas deserti]
MSDPEVVAVAASPLRMLGDAFVPVCVDDACIIPVPSNAGDDSRD